MSVILQVSFLFAHIQFELVGNSPSRSQYYVILWCVKELLIYIQFSEESFSTENKPNPQCCSISFAKKNFEINFYICTNCKWCLLNLLHSCDETYTFALSLAPPPPIPLSHLHQVPFRLFRVLNTPLYGHNKWDVPILKCRRFFCSGSILGSLRMLLEAVEDWVQTATSFTLMNIFM